MRAAAIEMVDEDASAPFCAACGSLVQSALRQGGGRIRPRRKYCERHFRIPSGFNQWVQQLGAAAHSADIVSRWTNHLIELEKACKSSAFDRDYPLLHREATQRLNSGLRYLAAELCGAGQGTGKIVARDVTAWAARLCGAPASETAHALGTSRRTVSTSNDKVARAVARAADLCGDNIAAIRDALLALAARAGYPSASPASPWSAAELRKLAAFIDAQERARRASWPQPIDIRPVVEALLKLNLVTLIRPAALLSVSPAAGLPDAAFDPRGFLRRLVRRSRLGKPPEPDSVLNAYLLAAKKREHTKLLWDEDPAFVLVTGLSLIKDCITASKPAPLKPRADDELQSFGRALAVTAGKIEPEMRRLPQYSRFAELVAVEENKWGLAQAEHDRATRALRHPPYPSAAAVSHAKRTLEEQQEATIQHMKVVEDRKIELDTRTINRIAHKLTQRRVRKKLLALAFLLKDRQGKLAEVGRQLGISRQAVWKQRPAADHAFAKMEEILAEAIPQAAANDLPREKLRVEMQREAMRQAIRAVVLSETAKEGRWRQECGGAA